MIPIFQILRGKAFEVPRFYQGIKQLIYYSSLLLFLPCLFTNAQLIPDGSLGKESSTLNPSIERDLIEGGAIRNQNLFHIDLIINHINRYRILICPPIA